MYLFVTRKFPPGVGGMQRMARALATELARRHSVTLIAWSWPTWSLPLFLPLALLRSLLFGLFDRDLRVALYGDALLAPLALVWQALLRRPAVVIAHGLDVVYPHPLYRRLVLPALRRVHLVVAVSENTRSLCLARGVKPERCVVIANGVEVEGIDVDAGHAEMGTLIPTLDGSASAAPGAGSGEGRSGELERLIGRAPAGRRLLVTVGRLVERKGVVWFVESVLPHLVRRESRVMYIVAGDGPDRARIERIVRDRGLAAHCRILGCVSDSDLGVLYSTADIFIMPNIPVQGDVEGFGIVALEAAAAGAPVIGGATDGIPSAVADGVTGMLAPAGDAGAFVDAIMTLLTDEERRRHMGHAGRERVRREFSWDAVGDRYVSVLDEAAGRRSMDYPAP